MKEPKQATIIAALLTRFRKSTPERHTPGDYAIAIDAESLCRLGRTLNRIAEAKCNGYGDAAKHETRWQRVATKARDIAESYDLSVSVQGDPRGACLRIGTKADCERESGVACL